MMTTKTTVHFQTPVDSYRYYYSSWNPRQSLQGVWTNAIASLSVILFDGFSYLVFNTGHRYWRALIANEYLTQHNIGVLISNWKPQKPSRCRFLLVNLTTTMSRPITRYNIVEYHYTPHPQLRVQVISHSLHSVPICSCGWRGCCK